MSEATFPMRREAAQDERLSLRARGIIALHKSRPRGWRSDAVSIARQAKEGERAVRTALTELERFGYLRRERVRNDRGQMVTEWHLSDRPGRVRTERRFPPVGKPPVGSPPAGKPQGGQSPVIEVGERGVETPPPTPSISDVTTEQARALALVVVEEVEGKAPKPGLVVLTAACARLGADGWTADSLRAAIRAHDWTGARAGAVVAYVRRLEPGDAASAQAAGAGKERPDWCGRCDETTRLTEDPQSGRQRRCPDCHPLTSKTRRTS